MSDWTFTRAVWHFVVGSDEHHERLAHRGQARNRARIRWETVRPGTTWDAGADSAKEDVMLDAFKTNGSSPPADITVQNEGSILVLTGRTDLGRDWIEENCSEGDYNPFGHGARLVEHRYIGDIVRGAIGDGLVVQR